MPPAPGRDQREPMERLIRLATVLQHRGAAGVDGDELAKVAGFADGKDAGSQLAREFRHMRELGWQIDNIADVGEAAVFRMTAVDNRLRLRLSNEQQTALRRAVLLADRGNLVERLGLPAASTPDELTAAITETPDDGSLTKVISALRLGCVLTCRYKGTERTLHPQTLRSQSGVWYLDAHETGGEVLKAFVVSRMSDVAVGAPGTAIRTGRVRHEGLHPLTWEVDPPVDVTLRTPVEYAADVRRWLGTPASEVTDGGTTELVYTVTHRAALRRRLVELGTRVQLVGPPDVRAEFLDELAFMAGE
ncbi:MAG: WYL domain-containing protein [Marmoricola sp.]